MRDRPTAQGFGRTLDEFEVGRTYKHWPGRTITEADDTFFCMLTMNHHPLHLDAAYAAQTEFGQRVVVGTLVFSLAVGLSVRDMTGRAIAALGYREVKHHGPVFHGDTIYCESQVTGKRQSESRPDAGVVEFETRVFNQKGELVMTFSRSSLVPRGKNEIDERGI
jgi:acyl dehydratase